MNERAFFLRDAALPQLGIVSDTDALARALHEHLVTETRDRIDVARCAVDRIKYRPARNCVLALRMSLVDKRTGRVFDQRAYGTLHEPQEARRRFEAEQCMNRAGDALLPALSLLKSLPLVLRISPYDRKLQALPTLFDKDRAIETARAVISRFDPASAIGFADTQHEVVSYFPEHSCTIRLDGAGHNSDVDSRWRVYGKTRFDDAGAETLRVMQALDTWVDQSCAPLRLARPLGYRKDDRLLWQEGVTGHTLAAVLDSNPRDAGTMRRVADALAHFHGAPIPVERTFGLLDQIGQINQTATLVATATPDIATRVHALAATLTARAADVDPAPRALLHGDLHSKNILVSDKDVYFIDLDRVRRGSPLGELGGLLAELATRDCVSGIGVSFAVLRTVVESYARASGQCVLPHEIAWHFAAALIAERVKRSITSIKPGPLSALASLLNVAEQALANPQVFERDIARMKATA